MKAYIYKIKRKDYEFEVYIGQTIQPLNKRLNQHFRKYDNINIKFKEWLNKYEKENIEIILIEEIEYNNKLEIDKILNEKELFWTEFYRNNSEYKVFNKRAGNTGRSNDYRNSKPIKINGIEYKSIADCIRNGGSIYEIREEYYKKNKNKISEYQKEYYEKNKNIILKKRKDYREKNEEKVKEYQKEYQYKNKEKISEYQKECRENNNEYYIEYRKKYNKKNEEKIKELQREYNKKNEEKIKEYQKEYQKEYRENNNEYRKE